ncbi:hypothetical protein WICPIJ_007284 [Wickerhamomyces pijperi]|uniref:mRNA decay factor PAT1 domain-containing protein n=1 Tax=Wickerhamomyces pijperi TaxID=599730 RepID=A0A9P8TK38_WICPI|nr:hypothetical protein WICPIJ_007284 [Wickerhamomyces pijperi]
MSYKKPSKNEVLNFEDSYAGYDDEEEDAYNDATFGVDIPLDQEFNFGGPQTQFSAQAPAQQVAQELPSINYADAARTKPVSIGMSEDSMQPLESLWGGQPVQQQQNKPLSLDELEAEITQNGPSGMPPSSSGAQQFPGQGPFPPQQQQQGPPPGAFPQQPNFGYYPPGFVAPPPMPFNNIPMNFNLGQIHPQQFAQLPPQLQHQLIQQHEQNMRQQFQQQQGQQQQPGQPQQDPHQQVTGNQSSAVEHQHQPDSLHQAAPPTDLSEFPVLGSDEAKDLKTDHQHFPAHPMQQQQFAPPQQQQYNQHNNFQQHGRRHNNSNNHYHHHHYENMAELSEEERQRFQRRQSKVQRILQYSGIMTPRDKDFVTRVQLSHIVTDDPYNEDFYFQVFRLLRSGDQNSGNNNSIAQAYLDFSGHRLGGRYQRADLALQRMQQQVQRAVTVAKERPRTGQYVKEGALGRISFSSGKKPRKQLEFITQRPELPEITKVGKKATLLQIENIYQEVLSLESQAREKKELNTEALWDSLRLFDDSQQLNPFIQVLSYEKGVKVFPRIFGFLSRQQKLTIVTLIFANLSLIKIISKSSFKTHENETLPAETQKLIDTFEAIVVKPIIFFLSYDAVLTEIIGLLTIVVERNNVSFLSTSKLGVLLLTILLSRAEIIKQDQSISQDDLNHWQQSYDRLFSSLETKLSLIFPKTVSEESGVKPFDDSYIWQFLASLALSGKLNHQRIIVDEIRDEVFGSVAKSKTVSMEEKYKILTNLNLFLNVIGLNATEEQIVELN